MSPIFRRRPPEGAPPGPADEPTRVERVDETVVEERWPEERVVAERPAYEEVVEERVEPVHRRRRDDVWPWLLLLLLLVLAGLAALFFLTREDERTTVPRLVGLQESAAVQRVEDAGLEALVSRRANRRPRGIVFAQRPGAGAQLENEESVNVLVSTGPALETVPNVVGLPVAEALERFEGVRGARFEIRQRRIFSDEPVGIVVAQDPKAGEEIGVGAPIRINISKGTGRVDVPDVVGQTARVAAAMLRRAGLDPRPFEVPAPEPAGTVIAQNPPGGAQATKGDRVRINVATGADQGGGTGTTTGTDTGATETGATETGVTETSGTDTTGGAAGGQSPARTVAVPSVVGKPLRVAQRQLRALAFVVRVDYVASPRPENVVVSQRPAAGTRLRRGGTILLRASSGTRAARAVPDVVGLTAQEATAELRAAGFRAEIFAEPTPDPAEEGLVIRQEPAAGARAPSGTSVTIYVGRM